MALVAPRQWSIAVRSASLTAAVVLIAFTVASVGLVFVLNRSLTAGVDSTVGVRADDISLALARRPPDQLEDDLLATDAEVVAIQVLDGDGQVVRRSGGNPSDSVWVSARTVDTNRGTYTVSVGAGTGAVRATVRQVVLLLAAAAVLVMAVAATVTYVMVKRSLRAVEAMRSRVAQISGPHLGSRVPLPPSHDEIHALAVTMNDMLDRMESSHIAQRRFVGDASHELRTPLDTIVAALETVKAHPDLLSHDLASGTLLPEAHRMKTLVEDLLLLARADERGLPLRRAHLSVEDLLTTEAARVRDETPLLVNVHCAQISAWLDPAGLSRVMRNLLDNAAQHARTKIVISAKHEAGQLVLTVADDGPGIPPEDRTRVFTRFVRLDTSSATGGAGLGLAIVAEIVSAHGGTVDISESLSGGSEVTVRIPLRQQSVADATNGLDGVGPERDVDLAP
ncbi:ATP-binding protein [soil metagenome]